VDDRIRQLARQAGIAVDWIDAGDQPQRVSVNSLRTILDALGYPCASKSQIDESQKRLRELSGAARSFFSASVGEPIALGEGRLPAISEPGYHRLLYQNRDIPVAVAPPRCVTLDDIAPGERLYALTVQIYSLRRSGNAGFGDTGALIDLIKSAADEKADAVALSPTHSLFAADPSHYAPYSPSSRLFLNPLYADPVTVLGHERVARVRDSPPSDKRLIDWPNAAQQKYDFLRRIYDDFVAQGLDRQENALARDFRSFELAGGERLREHALFEALHRHWFGTHGQWHWTGWPEGWRRYNDDHVARFSNEHANDVQFHIFLQWIADRSFASAQKTARDAGMRIGLISDLAVGMSSGGSHAWSRQSDLLLGLNVGAPPDQFNTRGQDWGLTGFSPQALIASGFEPFIATLRAAMRNAGGVRIDHAMGLTRLWLVPQDASPAEGAYLAYPLDDLLRLIALESHLNRAIVIGEDLGTVQPEFRERLSGAGIAGMDVLWFQRDGDAFLPPEGWRHDAVAMTSTHDLPTVAGWWTGADIATRDALGLVAHKRAETRQRAKDRAALWEAFSNAGIVDQAMPASNEGSAATDAAIAFAAQSPAPLALIPIEDVLGSTDQTNVPGTIDQHPNWRRRLDRPAARVLHSPQARARLKALRER
jgi:4-alpha-glucanotransferase